MKFSQLDTPSGHIACGFLLLWTGIFCVIYKVAYAEAILMAGLTTIGLGQRGLNGKGVVIPAADDETTANKKPPT